MKVVGSPHGRIWKFSLTVDVGASIASINCRIHDQFGASFHELSYTPIVFHLLPRVSQTSSYFHKHSVSVHRFPIGLLPWKISPTSIELNGSKAEVNGSELTSMEASTNIHGSELELNLLPGRLMDVDLLPWKLMEEDLLQWKLVEAFSSTSTSTSTYFHLFPSTSTCTFTDFY